MGEQKNDTAETGEGAPTPPIVTAATASPFPPDGIDTAALSSEEAGTRRDTGRGALGDGAAVLPTLTEAPTAAAVAASAPPPPGAVGLLGDMNALLLSRGMTEADEAGGGHDPGGPASVDATAMPSAVVAPEPPSPPPPETDGAEVGEGADSKAGEAAAFNRGLADAKLAGCTLAIVPNSLEPGDTTKMLFIDLEQQKQEDHIQEVGNPQFGGVAPHPVAETHCCSPSRRCWIAWTMSIVGTLVVVAIVAMAFLNSQSGGGTQGENVANENQVVPADNLDGDVAGEGERGETYGTGGVFGLERYGEASDTASSVNPKAYDGGSR